VSREFTAVQVCDARDDHPCYSHWWPKCI